MSTIYCTYLTTYRGNKLPPFYIGSSTVKKVESGYRGSVSSKKYKSIWKSELKQNPDLFKTKIISLHETSEEAREKELKLQKALNVVHSPLYINQSYASVNGYFGVSVTGKNNPWYGRRHGEESRKKMSKSCSGENHPRYGKTGENNPLSISFWAVDPYGVKHIAKGIKHFAILHNLSESRISYVLQGKGSQHKNWTFGYIEEYRQPLIEKKTTYYNGAKRTKFDHSIYRFFNIETKEIFEGERFVFIKKYNLNPGSVCELLKQNLKTHHHWILLEKIS